ncbi:MAG: HNH endonuclease [Pirellulales bacterium]
MSLISHADPYEARPLCQSRAKLMSHRQTDAERFWTKMEVLSNSCFRWRAGKSSMGGGVFWFRGKTWSNQRVAFVLAWGEIPEGMEVHRYCQNVECCNPAHLIAAPDDSRDHGSRLPLHGPKWEWTQEAAGAIRTRLIAGERFEKIAIEFHLVAKAAHASPQERIVRGDVVFRGPRPDYFKEHQIIPRANLLPRDRERLEKAVLEWFSREPFRTKRAWIDWGMYHTAPSWSTVGVIYFKLESKRDSFNRDEVIARLRHYLPSDCVQDVLICRRTWKEAQAVDAQTALSRQRSEQLPVCHPHYGERTQAGMISKQGQ